MPKLNPILLGATAALTLGLAHSAVAATTFNFSGAIDTWTAPTTGFYQILAWGAQGGNWPSNFFPNPVGTGGRGAEVGGDVFLNAGATLFIVVGGIGGDGEGDTGGGGGGGTWIFTRGAGPTDIPLAIAGGGGGTSYAGLGNGQDGQITTGAGLGGTGGGFSGGGGGAGWLGNGQDAGSSVVTFGVGPRPYGTGGLGLPSFLGGSTVGCRDFNYCFGNVSGGFGGGGGAGYDFGGGGGGYSGGDGGRLGARVGLGGGSYLDAGFTNVVEVAGARSGNGLVTISDVRGLTPPPAPVPEPATWAVMLTGFFTTGLALRRRRRPAAAQA
ncbi:MAG: PEPxxWA-CTERM sorting domain-containing protein [Phenylobacterium sp.]